jgi:predicted lipid-binding transport protein (Tim44 family)
MTNLPNEHAEHGDVQPPADRPGGSLRDEGFLGLAERGEEHLFHTREAATEQERLIDLEQQEVDGTIAGLNDRTPATLPGVDTGAIRRVDPQFDDEAFRAIARETFYKVREARSAQNPQESAELVSPHIQREIQDAVSGDVVSHRHHLLPFLWLNDAVIARAEVVDDREQIDVRFSISAAEQDVDDATGAAVAGDRDEHSWEELWRFTRRDGADTSASDERHQITSVRADQWMFAHRGWVVTDIARSPGS